MPKENQINVKLDDKTFIILKGLSEYYDTTPTELLREIAVRGIWKLFNIVRMEEGVSLEEMLKTGEST